MVKNNYTYKRLTKVLVGTLVTVFSILIAGGLLIFKNEAPRPAKIVTTAGETLVTRNDYLAGKPFMKNTA